MGTIVDLSISALHILLFVELILKMGPSQKLRSLCFFRKPESWNFPKICVLIAVVRKIRQRHKKHHGAQQGAGEANLHLLWRKKRGGCLFSRYCVFVCFLLRFFGGKEMASWQQCSQIHRNLQVILFLKLC